MAGGREKEGGPKRRIKVKLRYVGMIRRLMAREQEEVELPAGTTLKDLLEHLISADGPELRKHLFTARGELMPTANLVVDGLNAMQHGGLQMRLCEQGETQVEVVVLGPPPMGG